MSKLKAKEKAKSRIAKKAKELLAKTKRIEAEKQLQADKNSNDIKRNAIEKIDHDVKVLKINAKSDIKLYSAKAQNAFFEICKSIGADTQVAKDFVLEEIEAASNGNNEAKAFARNSGISKSEYENVTERELRDVENGPQQKLLELCAPFLMKGDISGGLKFRTSVVEAIMKKYLIGKYSTCNASPDEDKVDLLFKEYLNFINKPKLTSASDFTRIFLPALKSVENPSKALQTHALAMEMINTTGILFRTTKIPAGILKNISTDLAVISVAKKTDWISSGQTLFKRGRSQKDLEQAIELFIEIQPSGHSTLLTGYVNGAPAMYNAMNLIYAELNVYHECKEKYKELMFDDSFVEGRVRGSIMFNLHDWVESIDPTI
jgi:hypothetical protein